MPGQGLVELVTQKVEQVQPKAAVLDKATVGDDILQVTHQAELEEDHRVDGLLAAAAVVLPRQLVEEVQVEPLL